MNASLAFRWLHAEEILLGRKQFETGVSRPAVLKMGSTHAKDWCRIVTLASVSGSLMIRQESEELSSTLHPWGEIR